MLRPKLAGLSFGILVILTLFCAFSPGIAGPQDQAKGQPPDREAGKETAKVASQPPTREAEKRAAQIAKMIAEYDLKPHPLPSIPDDPPPHEGAMISLPHIVEPTDLVIVEVLEALPGRPISGERLVRPDGKIDVGFYGEIDVRGMTLDQVKVALIKHLRKYLIDEVLGLEINEDEVETGAEMPETRSPFDTGEPNDNTKPQPSSLRNPSNPLGRGVRSAARRDAGVRNSVSAVRSRIARVATRLQKAPPPAAGQFNDRDGVRRIKADAIDPGGRDAPQIEKPHAVPAPGERQGPVDMPADESRVRIVPPPESDRVFVDITAYNSKNFYILGDVQIPGKLPWTGNETVLDALQFAGGLMASAEPKDIRLVRPGRGGKPAKVYNVDLAAIQERGDITANFQILPGDRLIVGRNEVVKKTVEIDRLNAPIQSVLGYMLQEAFVLRYLQFTTTENREELLKELVDFWSKELARPGGIKFDEQTLRDALIRKLKLTPPPLQAVPAPR